MRVRTDSGLAKGNTEMSLKKLIVKQTEKDPIPTEIIAQSIVDISAGMKQIRNGRLTHKALVLLLSYASGISQRDVTAVIDGLNNLERLFIVKKP